MFVKIPQILEKVDYFMVDFDFLQSYQNKKQIFISRFMNLIIKLLQQDVECGFALKLKSEMQSLKSEAFNIIC